MNRAGIVDNNLKVAVNHGKAGQSDTLPMAVAGAGGGGRREGVGLGCSRLKRCCTHQEIEMLRFIKAEKVK
jgi:hypothetical protein